MKELILGKQYTLTELSNIDGAYAKGNIYICDSTFNADHACGQPSLANGLGILHDSEVCRWSCLGSTLFTLKYLAGTSTPQVVKPYTLESSQKGMLPPIGATVILCVSEDACVTRRLHNLDGRGVTITDVNKNFANYAVEDEAGTYKSYANFSWFKPVAKSDLQMKLQSALYDTILYGEYFGDGTNLFDFLNENKTLILDYLGE
tara:strand:+ start:123 stop:734 length:612 start_codon:yes stop_codon:yes gene_type:complete